MIYYTDSCFVPLYKKLTLAVMRVEGQSTPRRQIRELRGRFYRHRVWRIMPQILDKRAMMSFVCLTGRCNTVTPLRHTMEIVWTESNIFKIFK